MNVFYAGGGIESLSLYLVRLAIAWVVVRMILVQWLLRKFMPVPALLVTLIDVLFALLAIFAVLRFLGVVL